MPTGLPNGAQASIDLRKLEDYCLNLAHPKGCHKARVFRDVLGLTRADAGWLRAALLAAAACEVAEPVGCDQWGRQWRLDVEMARQGREVVVRSIWIVRTGEHFPRFVSAWVMR